MPNDGSEWIDEPEIMGREGTDTRPSLPHRFSTMLISVGTVPVDLCSNGHVREWENEEFNSRLALLYQVKNPTTWAPVCTTCGEVGEEVDYGREEEAPDSSGD